MAKLGGRRIRIAQRDPWVRFRVGVSFLGLVLVVGSVGYMLLGLGPLDAVYQTVITVSTVGYREIGDFDRQYAIFTIFLILFGTGTVLYTLGVLLETLFEGQLDDQFRRRRMQRSIDQLEGHVIVCGYGQVGRAIVDEMRRAGRDVVVVDRADLEVDDFPEGVHAVLGEATEDAVLAAAGLARAETLVVGLDSDADNLFVALSARSQNETLFIVSRANSAGVTEKLERVGVNRVVNPHEIGGSRMAAMVLQPDVTDFLDVVMHDRELEVRMAEIEVIAGSRYVDSTIVDILMPDHPTTMLVAVRRGGAFITNPPSDLHVHEGDILIALGTDDHLRAIAAGAG
ncbi:MAG: potassium channel protein [Acidimicrobiales bacterium]|nr:potassium channel protein [Acidimicrobiales bacterium]